MFHQVRVRQEDRSALRFFWRPPGSTCPPAAYEWNVQPFGATSSPAICCYALQQAAVDCGPHWETVQQQVAENFYVDNWLTSFEKVDQAAQVGVKVIDALKRAGFVLTQFASSHPELLVAIGVRANNVDVVDLDLDTEAIERTLGLVWNHQRDTFQLRITPKLPPRVTTKRELLRASSSLYDPLGFLAAVKLRPKLLFQETCRQKVGWDDPLDEKIADEWEDWAKKVPCLAELEIPRCIQPQGLENVPAELHLFADASEYAFGAVAYALYQGTTQTRCVMIMAKSHLSSIKPSTIPRNELNAALLAARLCKTLIDELKMAFKSTVLWSDSTTVLRWLNSAKMKFNAYTGARIGEILELTAPSQWRYVPSAENPADEASRGIDTRSLKTDHRWFTGPSFLYSDPSEWPEWPDENPLCDVSSEFAVNFNVLATHVGLNRLGWLIERRSNVHKLWRIAAYLLRATNNLRTKQSQRRIDVLDSDEIRQGRELLLRYVQSSDFAKELTALKSGSTIAKESSLTSLSPFVNSHGLLCVGGRISCAKLPPDSRYPIILPRQHRLTRLIVEDIHRFDEKEHLSSERTLQELRRFYWVTRGRETVSTVLHSCLWCKLRRAKVIQPKMSDLPSFRVDCGSPAFCHTGVDYFGPFQVTIFRRVVKRWICLFTCLTSRAVHLEIAYALSTDSFLSCLVRFEARRGTPADYHSDNGTNFVGAVNELGECLQNLDQAKIVGILARRGVRWHFNPPSAPHFGGAWERLVGTAKRALVGVLSGRTVTDEVLSTAVTQIESLINSRPLTYLSSSPDDLEPLTPNHLILGRSNPSFSPDIFLDRDLTARKQWRHSQAIATQFWSRWMKEVLPAQIARKKWTSDDRNLQAGDVVALLDPDNPRGCWKLGRIIQVYLSRDGLVRSALVRTANVTPGLKLTTSWSEFDRPVARMCLLLPADEKLVPGTGHGAGDVPKEGASNSPSLEA